MKQTNALVDFHDPYIPHYMEDDSCIEGLPEISGEVVSDYDLVVITTAHSVFDYEMIAESATMIFDTRNAMENIKERENIEVL